MTLEISLLGPPRLARDGLPVSFDTRKAMALLAHLALAERARSRDALCQLLWSGQDTDHARGALRRTLSTLRKVVGEEWIDASGDSLALVRGPGLELDVDRFRGLVAAGEFRAAADLFRGELLEGFALRDDPDFEIWHSEQADLLQRELATALRRTVQSLAENGADAEAIPYARRWLDLDPLNEAAHCELIRLYARTGDRAAALDQYRSCVRILSQELGVAPLDETARLFEQVSEGELRPAAPASRATPAPRPAPPGELPLVGREAEIEALLAAHDRAPAGFLAVIEGEAGIGKTRLAQELATAAAARGALVLSARCHEDEASLAYAPVVQLIAQALPRGDWPATLPAQTRADASLLVPELADGTLAPLSADAPGAKTRLLEAVAKVLGAAAAGPVPGVIFVDDVHAADEATVDVLAYLARRLSARPLLLMLAWRREAVPPGHRLRDLVRDGAAAIVRPTRLTEAEVAELVPDAVFADSEGIPAFVVEAAAPEGRLSGVDDIARQVVGAAAVIGRSFGLDAVREVSGRSEEEVVGALEALTARGVLREAPGGKAAYDFSHEKLRAHLYEETSLARRRLLHRRAADLLAHDPRQAALAAHHFRAAGDDAAAAAQHRIAADEASAVLAHAEALEHLEAAVALGHPETAALHERIGDVCTLLGDYLAALSAYETAAADRAGGELAAVELKLAGVHGRRGDWRRAATRLVGALEAAPEDRHELRARITSDLSLAAYRLGEGERAAELALTAASLAETADDRRAQAQAHNILGILARDRGHLEEAREAFAQSLGVAEALEDSEARVAALNNLALVARDAGDTDEALVLTEQALALCVAMGDRHREAALENNLADLHHAAGRPDDAMEHLTRAVSIFAEVGGDEAVRLPEIWKLVSW